LSAVFAGCGSEHKKPTLEYMPHMMDTPAIKAQRVGPFDTAMRVPPEGTVSQTTEVYHFADNPEAAGKELVNPLPRTHAVMMRGQHLYNTYCIVCHGSKGEGNGFIVPKFPQPPTLQSDKVRGWPDGRVFHVMTVGQNLMPSYASQIAAADRWAVIHYLRVLQRALNPTDADVKELQAASKAEK
jgi:mono/diheme cytochrome c family protein